MMYLPAHAHAARRGEMTAGRRTVAGLSAAFGLPAELSRQLFGISREATQMISHLFELSFEPAEAGRDAAIGPVAFRPIAGVGAPSPRREAEESELGPEPLEPTF
jgi:hypothetical protein